MLSFIAGGFVHCTAPLGFQPAARCETARWD